MDERVITKTIRTQLTDHQLADVAREAAAKQQLITAMEGDLQATTKARKADIAKIQAEFDALIKLAGDACTEEEMDVIERFDLARGVAVWLHPRTLEHLGERELTDKEKGGPIGELCGPRIFLDETDETEAPADETKPAEAEAPESDMPPQDIDEGTTGEDPRPARRRRAHKDAPPVNAEPAPVNETPAPVNTGHSLDARDNGYTPPAPKADTGAARQCRCGHASGVHGTDEYGRLTGCMVGGCGCRRHVEADPLGLDGWVPPSERKEVSDEAS